MCLSNYHSCKVKSTTAKFNFNPAFEDREVISRLIWITLWQLQAPITMVDLLLTLFLANPSKADIVNKRREHDEMWILDT